MYTTERMFIYLYTGDTTFAYKQRQTYTRHPEPPFGSTVLFPENHRRTCTDIQYSHVSLRVKFHGTMPSILHTFRRDEDKKDYVRGIIAGIGICKSIKAVSTDAYNTVLAIVQNHAEATAKLKDIEDFYIMKNVMGAAVSYGGNPSNAGFTLMIKKTSGGETDVSYIKSATGKGPSPRTVFHECLRVSVGPQIREFKDNCTDKICALCSKTLTKVSGREADHVKHFATIVDEFILMQPAPFTYPTETKEYNDGTHRYRLTDADSELEEAFISYHELEADLRLTCSDCNRKRGGPKKTTAVATKKRKLVSMV
jgi:hypothetical protein